MIVVVTMRLFYMLLLPLVETVGVEPTSEKPAIAASTCVVYCLILDDDRRKRRASRHPAL